MNEIFEDSDRTGGEVIPSKEKRSHIYNSTELLTTVMSSIANESAFVEWMLC